MWMPSSLALPAPMMIWKQQRRLTTYPTSIVQEEPSSGVPGRTFDMLKNSFVTPSGNAFWGQWRGRERERGRERDRGREGESEGERGRERETSLLNWAVFNSPVSSPVAWWWRLYSYTIPNVEIEDDHINLLSSFQISQETQCRGLQRRLMPLDFICHFHGIWDGESPSPV